MGLKRKEPLLPPIGFPPAKPKAKPAPEAPVVKTPTPEAAPAPGVSRPVPSDVQPAPPCDAPNKLVAIFRSKPAWFWISIVAGIWLAVMIAKLFIFPAQYTETRRYREWQEIKQQQEQVAPDDSADAAAKQAT